jgi:acetate kinase
VPGEKILTVNVGSSSVKLRLVDGDDAVTGTWDFEAAPPAERLAAAVGRAAFDAVGHRFVHGGPRLSETRMASEEVRAELRRVTPLAPLHNGAALELLEQLQRALPRRPHLVCFDTAFHRSLPAAAAVYPVPWDWTERLGVRRYGFHGLSHAYAARRTAQLLDRTPAELRTVTCHLGAGASLAAVAGGVSVDTTMGFTPNEGLVMATRSGSVGPGALLWVLREAGLSPEAADDELEHRAGLAGVSGISGDMREVLAAEKAGSARARLAVAVYVHRLRAGIAAMAAAMAGIDAICFTGGVGEHAPAVRAAACAGLGYHGVELDREANESGSGDRVISTAGAATATVVVAAREELEIAAEVRRVLATQP